MRRRALVLVALFAVSLVAAGPARKPDGNRLTYLDANDPYYPHLGFPRLITPQWVGEEGVEAVVVLAIDDMRDPAKYEAYLRPILNRLKAIDGRAPVSIMTCKVKPDDPQLQAWLKEGLNFDVHTIAHPCPLLQKDDFLAARKTVDDCIDLLNAIPGNRPVAFRMPCCDSLNTPSPRFFAEIFNRATEKEHFLTIDSSVFNITTPADPDLPRSLVEDPDGGERFRKYLPFPSFVNTIENYPYPYVINRLCWEFPCIVPSDWEAQHLNKPNSPKTLEDMKAALDAVVLKRGVFNLVFHPHGWIKSEQIVALIDHAVSQHGKKVKFLNFREAQERLDKNLLKGNPLRAYKGVDYGVRILDVNNDGYMDVVIGNGRTKLTRLWQPESGAWREIPFPANVINRVRDVESVEVATRFGVLDSNGYASMIGRRNDPALGDVNAIWKFDGDRWAWDDANNSPVDPVVNGKDWAILDPMGVDRGARLRDVDGDGVCELIVANAEVNGVFAWSQHSWKRLPFGLPDGVRIQAPSWTSKDRTVKLTDSSHDAGLRFVDLDEDGRDDLVYSNDTGYRIDLFSSLTEGWSRKVAAGGAGTAGALPKIVAFRETKDENWTEFMDNGFWVHSRHLWWQNEHTASLPDLVDRRSFNELLKNVPAQGKSVEASLKSLRVRPGFKVELAASEPLVLDPIAMDWSADGRMWVVEMGDYPLGVDGQGKHGGVVRVLEDTDRNGVYDKMSVFLDGLGFPTGVMPWRNGVLVACAPDILYAEDRDGDGKADHREVLYTGFREGNQQHRLNGFELGLDGWIYGANGDSGGVVRSTRTGQSVDIRGRDFRFRPDTGEIEAESGTTQFGRHRDDWGRWFGNNNPNWAWIYMLSDADLRRNRLFAAPDPRKMLEPDNRLYPVSYTAPRFNDLWAAGRVTSANSPTPYRDDLFGPHFENSLFVSDPVHNLVHRMNLEADGPSLVGRRAVGEGEREFLASSDSWFRSTMLKTGPDGALWVCDMDRAVIEHPEWIPDEWEKRLDLRAGADRGRIFRVVPVDRPARAIPRLDRLDTAELVAALESSNGWQRDTAHRLLLHRNDPSAVALLTRLAVSTPRPKTRVQALWVLENLGGLTAEPVVKALADAHPQVRRNAARVSEGLLAKSPEVGEALLKLVSDADAAVRFQVVLTLGNWDDPRAGKALAELARKDGADPWFRAAVATSAPLHISTLLTSLFAEPGQAPPAGVVEPLFILAGSTKDRAALLSLVRATVEPAGLKGRYAGWQFSAFAGLLDASRRAGQSLEQWGKGSPELAAAVRRLDALWPAVHEVALDSSANLADREAAVSLLGREPGRRDVERGWLADFLKPQVPSSVQLAAVSALARGRDPKLPEPLLAGWKSFTPAFRSAVLDTLLSRPDWMGMLLSSLEDSCTNPAEIDPAHRRRLLENRDDRIRSRAAAVFGPGTRARDTVIAEYRKALAAPGDPKGGEAVFKRVCSTCHKVREQGVDVGADLATLQDRSPEAMLTAILDPSRAFETKFTEFTVALTDGRVKTGMIASETASAITLKRQQGEQDEILRADIEAITTTGKSLMPEGLEKDLTPRDLADVIAFLNAALPMKSPAP